MSGKERIPLSAQQFLECGPISGTTPTPTPRPQQNKDFSIAILLIHDDGKTLCLKQKYSPIQVDECDQVSFLDNRALGRARIRKRRAHSERESVSSMGSRRSTSTPADMRGRRREHVIAAGPRERVVVVLFGATTPCGNAISEMKR